MVMRHVPPTREPSRTALHVGVGTELQLPFVDGTCTMLQASRSSLNRRQVLSQVWPLGARRTAI